MGWKETLDAYREEKTPQAEAVYEKGKDVHVRKYMVYGDTTDSKLYGDAAFQKVLNSDDVYNAAMFGTMVIFDGTNYNVVVSFVKDSYKTVDGASTPAGKTWTLATEPKSEE